MNAVYCVESSECGLLKVFANLESAHAFLCGLVDTHSEFCGKMVWLDKDLNGLANHNGAYIAVVCNAKWERKVTITLSAQSVLNLL